METQDLITKIVSQGTNGDRYSSRKFIAFCVIVGVFTLAIILTKGSNEQWGWLLLSTFTTYCGMNIWEKKEVNSVIKNNSGVQNGKTESK